MEWLELTIKTTSTAIDVLSDHLTAIGYDSFIIDDTADFEEFLEGNTQYWDYVDENLAQKMKNISQIRLYIESDDNAAGRISALKSNLDSFRQTSRIALGSLEIEVNGLQEEDWENNWKQYYNPIEIGDRLLVVPEWITPENPDNRVCIKLDPGMIFGTGAHASTQMCLAELEKVIIGGENVIDLGSGSGILSIAALLLGAHSSIGIDIDPKAEDIARENALLNGLRSPEFQAITGNVIADSNVLTSLQNKAKYDVILANIVADVIIPLSAVVPSLLANDGVFICSGILNTRLEEVKNALRASGLFVTTETIKNDWCCLVAVLKEG